MPSRPAPGDPVLAVAMGGRGELVARYRQPPGRIAVTVVETTEGLVEVWPGDDGQLPRRPPPLAHGDEETRTSGRAMPLHRGVRLDDLDAVSVLEDFLEEHVRTGRGLVHWEPTSVYVPAATASPALVGLVSTSSNDAKWQYTSA